MRITTNREANFNQPYIRDAQKVGGPIFVIEWEEHLDSTDPSRDTLTMNVVFPKLAAFAFIREILSPEMLALKSDPHFDYDEDGAGSGWAHTEVLGPSAYIYALAAIAGRMGAARHYD
ncbi:hypothetical protein ACFZ8E_23580 [Methylobacterium sp. HMF5984]|uniref:hypothetical protein n=1 Tax=Methylobacterium sp. HMF5984 TaxID=3367370 RepID=UPI003853BB6F